MQSLHWLDYAILGILVLSVLTGCIRGFFKELISLSIWIIAGWLSLLYAKSVSLWLTTYIQDASIHDISVQLQKNLALWYEGKFPKLPTTETKPVVEKTKG